MLFQPKGAKWLVVFLGNPGDRYRDTRHNVGFLAADALQDKTGIRVKRIKYQSLTGYGPVGGEQAFILLPQTYMNLSGDAVKPAADFYRIPPERIIVVADDVTLAPGKLRLRRKGSAGGHNGLKSIISRLGSDEFPRIKIGVGSPPHPDYDMADWVLGRPTGQEKADILQAAKDAADAVEMMIRSGIDDAMNRFN